MRRLRLSKATSGSPRFSDHPVIMKKTLLFAVFSTILIAGCSVPTLVPESCTEARGPLKKLYSLHFDRGFEPDDSYKEQRGEFLSDRLKGEIDGQSGFDYLTQTGDPPKAFRIGKCTETGKDVVSFGVLLFWKDDQRDEQREINASMTRRGDGWVVDKVEKAN